MSYLGKEFRLEKEENYDALVTSFNLNEERTKSLLSFRPNLKLEKTDDGYKFVFIRPKGNMEFSFKVGETTEESHEEGYKSKTTWTVDGDTFTQVQDFGEVIITYKREFSDSQLKLTATTSKWDGVAYRWYTAA